MSIVAAIATSQPTTLVLAAALATRTAVIAVVTVGGLRLFGKRQLGQMNVYDLAMIMALANAVQNAMTTGSGSLAGGMAAAGSLFAVGAALTFAFRRSPSFERRVVGSPTLLAFDGHLLPERLAAEGMTKEEVMAAVREHGFAALTDVLTVTLEVDGSISVIARTAPRRRHRRALTL